MSKYVIQHQCLLLLNSMVIDFNSCRKIYEKASEMCACCCTSGLFGSPFMIENQNYLDTVIIYLNQVVKQNFQNTWQFNLQNVQVLISSV